MFWTFGSMEILKKAYTFYKGTQKQLSIHTSSCSFQSKVGDKGAGCDCKERKVRSHWIWERLGQTG